MNRIVKKILEHPIWGQAQDNSLASREMSNKAEDYIASPGVKKMMRFHGIDRLANEVDKQRSYFIRKGKRIYIDLPVEEYQRMLQMYDPSR